MKKIMVGSRDSKLAIAQTQLLLDYIKRNCPNVEAEMLTMKTTGDKILHKRLEEIGGKGLFVRELDIALKENRTQLSVHSLKDLPMEIEPNLPVLGFSVREDERDVLVLPEGADKLEPGLPIGTSSLRRKLQLQKLYPENKVEMIRGNVQTRLQKLDEGRFGGLVLAAAGLKRLHLEHRISRYFSCEEMLPAAGQGILAVQGRTDMDYGFLKGFFDADAEVAALTERAFVRELGGGCSSPVAAHAVVKGEEITLTGLYYEGGNDYQNCNDDRRDQEDRGNQGYGEGQEHRGNQGYSEDQEYRRNQEYKRDQEYRRNQEYGEHGEYREYRIEEMHGKRFEGEALGIRLAEKMKGNSKTGFVPIG